MPPNLEANCPVSAIELQLPSLKSLPSVWTFPKRLWQSVPPYLGGLLGCNDWKNSSNKKHSPKLVGFSWWFTVVGSVKKNTNQKQIEANWWFNQPLWKIWVKMGSSSPSFGVKIKKYLKAPPSKIPAITNKRSNSGSLLKLIRKRPIFNPEASVPSVPVVFFSPSVAFSARLRALDSAMAVPCGAVPQVGFRSKSKYDDLGEVNQFDV